MDRAYLMAMMSGELSAKKRDTPKAEKPPTQLLADMEKQINAHVDGMQFEEDYIRNGLQTSRGKREKIKLELKEAAKLPKLSEQIKAAIELILADGVQYLGKEVFQQVESDLIAAPTGLVDVSVKELSGKDLQHLAHISDASMQSIAEMGIAKFSESQFSDCLALFSLLSTLSPANPEYWLRQGIAAEKCDDLELAAGSYDTAIEIDPNFIEPRLLAIECCIKNKLVDEAKQKLIAAKEISTQTDIAPAWQELLSSLEELLQAL